MVWFAKDDYIFNHPWEEVVEGAVRKYPNPNSPNVQSTDVLDRKVDPESGVIKSTKLISSVWAGSAMQYIHKFTGLSALLKPINAIEFSTIDARNKKYELTSRNLSLSSYIQVDEKLTYAAHPTIPDTTVLKQSWQIEVKGLSFKSFLEGFLGNNMMSNSKKGRSGVEYVINQIKEEVKSGIDGVIQKGDSLIDETLKEVKSGFDDVLQKSEHVIDDALKEVKSGLDEVIQKSDSLIDDALKEVVDDVIENVKVSGLLSGK